MGEPGPSAAEHPPHSLFADSLSFRDLPRGPPVTEGNQNFLVMWRSLGSQRSVPIRPERGRSPEGRGQQAQIDLSTRPWNRGAGILCRPRTSEFATAGEPHPLLCCWRVGPERRPSPPGSRKRGPRREGQKRTPRPLARNPCCQISTATALAGAADDAEEVVAVLFQQRPGRPIGTVADTLEQLTKFLLFHGHRCPQKKKLQRGVPF